MLDDPQRAPDASFGQSPDRAPTERHPDADPACTVPGCGYLDLCDACCARVDAAARAAGDDGVEPDRCPACRGTRLRGDWSCEECDALAEAATQRAEDLREYERDRFADTLRAIADHDADERRRNAADAHYEGDPPPVIGWSL